MVSGRDKTERRWQQTVDYARVALEQGTAATRANVSAGAPSTDEVAWIRNFIR